jgi:hypothetical protein
MSNRRILFLSALLAVLVLVLIFVQPVSADDGATPEPTTVIETEIPTVETLLEISETPAAEETPVPTATGEISPTVETTEIPAAETTIEPTIEPTEPAPDASEVVEELAQSGIELVDADSGSSITRDAGGVLEGDPYYKVGTITYRFLNLDGDCGTDTHCSLSANPIQAALDSMATNGTPSDRKLYIEVDDYTGEVVVDGTVAAVKPLTGFVVNKVNPDDVATLSGSITVHDMAAGFTISDFVVTSSADNGSAIYLYDNVGTVTLTNVDAKASGVDSSGIVIVNSGNVVMKQVDASQNGYLGAWIETSGTISITNSSFNSNLANISDGNSLYDGGTVQRTGLWIVDSSTLPVTLNGITAQHNSGGGAVIYAGGTLTVKNGAFDDNNGGGDVNADVGLMTEANSVILENISASNNDRSGIEVKAFASVSGKNLSVLDNGGAGINVRTCLGGLPCAGSGAGTVTLKNIRANGNGTGITSDGVYVSAKGAITLYDVTADGNTGYGINLDNEHGPLPALIKATLIEASSNSWNGININTRGALTITNVTANENTGNGVNIGSSGTAPIIITINSLYAHRYNETSGNEENGLEISANGPVTLVSLRSNDNMSNGLYLQNSGSNTAVTTIKVLDVTAGPASFTGNGWMGMVIQTNGPVIVANINASENHQIGAFLQSYHGAVSVTNGTFNYNCSKVGGLCFYSGTGASGLEVHSWGLIKLFNIIAIGNDGPGVGLWNNEVGATTGVTIGAGTAFANTFSNNFMQGLFIGTNGSVLLTNITASGNRGAGLSVHNVKELVTGNVTLNATAGMGNIFIGNTFAGVEIESDGSVTLANLTVIGNGGDGVNIDNSSGTLPVLIRQTGNWMYGVDPIRAAGNMFNGNAANGVNIISNGAVTIVLLQANSNLAGGIVVDADEGVGAVTVSGLAANYGTNVSFNIMNGLTITAKGNILLNYINSSNGSYGASLDNSAGPGSVTINYGYFNGNFNGLSVNTNGAVVWKNGAANQNTNFGAEINNSTAEFAKSVTISNVSANQNGETGLKINSKGGVYLANVSAEGNSWNGESINFGEQFVDNLSVNQTWLFYRGSGEVVTIEIDTDSFAPAFDVYDQNGAVLGSGETYLQIDGATGEAGYYTIVLTSLDGRTGSYIIDLYNADNQAVSPTASSQAYGIYVDNATGTSAAVSLINTSLLSSSNNSAENIYIATSGAVTVTNMVANDAGSYGLDIIGTTASGLPAVILTNIHANRNGMDGIYVLSMGAVTVRNATLNGNLDNGLDITNNNTVIYPKPVSLVNIAASSNGAGGIQVTSYGAVTLLTITASVNAGNGIDINTRGAVTATALTALSNSNLGVNISTEGAVLVNRPTSGYNTIQYNSTGGLYIVTVGRVALTRVNASNNGYDTDGSVAGSASGINITVTDSTGRSPILLTNLFTDTSTNDGLDITTNGAVTINLLDSDNNTGYGLRIEQGDGVIGTVHYVYPVIISRISTDGNGMDGIYLDGAGSITLSKFTANYNGGVGVSLNNKYASLNKASVTILNPAGGLAYNQVLGNGWVGLLIESNGAININGVLAEENGLDGVIISNNTSSTKATVTLTAIVSRNNGADGVPDTSGNGIYVSSLGLVTINNSVSTGNDWDGIQIFTEANSFINYTTSMGNGGAGIFADLDTLSGTFDLTLKGCSWFGNHDNNLIFLGDDLFIL